MSFQVPASGGGVAVLVNGGTVTNDGPSTIYYRDEPPVSSSVNDGSLAAGASARLDGTQWLLSASGLGAVDVRVGSVLGPLEDGSPVAAASYLGAYSPHVAIEQACIAAAAAGKTVKVAGTWHLTDKVDITTAVEVDCEGATIYQDTYGLPAFDLRGATGAKVKGGAIRNTQTKTEIAGTHADLDPNRDHAAAVYIVNSANCTVENISVDGFVAGVKLRGNTDNATLDVGHRVTGLRLNNVDFGVLWQQQDGLIVDVVQSVATGASQPTAPPHAIYGSQTTGTRSRNVSISNVVARGNTVQSAIKCRAIDGLKINGVVVDDHVRGLDIENCTGTVSDVVVRRMSELLTDSAQSGIDLLNCTNFVLSDSTVDVGTNDVPAVWVRSDEAAALTTDVTVRGVHAITAYDAAPNTRYAFWTTGGVRVHYEDCKHTASGSDDKNMFGFSDATISGTDYHCTDCTVSNPTLYGSTKVAWVRTGSVRTRVHLTREKLFSGFSATSVTDDAGDTRLTMVGGSRPLPAGLYLIPRGSTRGTVQIASRFGYWLEVPTDLQPVDQAQVNVTIAADAAGVLTLAIYEFRFGGSVTLDRVVLSSSTAVTTTGSKAITLTRTLLPRGIYLVALEATGHSATAPTVTSTTAPAVGVSTTGTTELFTTPGNGLNAAALANATGLPASFDLVTASSNAFGPHVPIRTAA